MLGIDTMVRKRKKTAKKKHVAQRTAIEKKTTTTNEITDTKTIEKWLRTMDKPLTIKEGGKRRK
jgi:hypothetical protein